MTLEKESGTSAPVFRRRNDLHWVALLEFVANSSVKQIGSGTNSVPRRENVCLMARESSALRNGPVRDSTQMSKKSFVRLLSSPSFTIASNFSAITVSRL